MSIIELKQKMHSQIELLLDKEDIEDLAANMDYFFQNRHISFDSNSSEMLGTLNNSLQQDFKQAITSDELRQKVKQWLTK